MRVLLAIDGSASSETARQLVDSLDWPGGTVIDVVAAVEPTIFPLGSVGAPMEATPPDDALDAEPIGEIVKAAAVSLERPGRIVRRTVIRGRAASVLVQAAETSRAELIVVGSRGLGPVRTMLLGSISAEVVDHAPCPVLVVRRPTIGRVLLAVDGSPTAAAAVAFLSGARFLTGLPIEVLSVAASAANLPRVPRSGGSDVAIRSDETWAAARSGWSEAFAAAAAEQLLEDGVPARWSISHGDPAHEIIGAAEGFPCDLVVMGSRGLTGLARLLIGSVARNVLLHTSASVLIVREPQRVRVHERGVSDDREAIAGSVTPALAPVG